MSFAALLSENVLIRLLTGRRTSYDLAVAMVGVKLGERLLVVGLGDARLLALLGAKTGLTGRAVGVDVDRGAVAAAATAADREGVLVETEVAPFAQLPFGEHAFDVAVVRARGQLADAAAFAAALGEIHRVLRAGGRIVVISDARGSNRGATAGRETLAQLDASGYRVAHLLAEREKLVFVGAVKPGNVNVQGATG